MLQGVREKEKGRSCLGPVLTPCAVRGTCGPCYLFALRRWAGGQDCRADEEGAVDPDPEEGTYHGKE